MHLVLGSERVDLGAEVLVIDRAASPEPVTVDDVHRAADAGAEVVVLTAPNAEVGAAAVERGLLIAVPPAGAARVAELAPSDRVLVLVEAAPPPTGRGIACLDLPDAGPAAWGRATVALAAGVRAVRTPEPAALRRVATVVDRIRTARAAQGGASS